MSPSDIERELFKKEAATWKTAAVYSCYLDYFRLQSYKLFTCREGRTVYKPLNSPCGLQRFAEMSTSLKAGELEATSASLKQTSQMRASWTPHTLRHGGWAQARTACRCDATSDWFKIRERLCQTYSHWKSLSGRICSAFHWYSLQLVAFQIHHTSWKV